MDEKEQLKSLKEQVRFLKKHIKWCKDNNKPQEQLDLHAKVIKQIKEEIKEIKTNG